MEGWFSPLHSTITRNPALPLSIGFDNAGVGGKAFARDQSFSHTPLQDAFEHESKRFAVAKAAMAILREGGVIGKGIV